MRLLLQLQEFMVRPCQAILQNDTLVQVGGWVGKGGKAPKGACGVLQVWCASRALPHVTVWSAEAVGFLLDVRVVPSVAQPFSRFDTSIQ